MGGLGVCCSSRKELDGFDGIDQDLMMRRSTYGELSSMEQANEFQIPPELVNPYEYKVKQEFSLNGIKKMIDEAESDLTDFQHIKKTATMDVYMKMGSPLNEKCPFSKVFYYFDASITSAKDILFFLTDVEQRPLWDMHIMESQLVSRISDIISVVHLGVKAPFPYTNRDFLEKRIYFKSDQSYYCYFSSTQDYIYPVPVVNGKPKFIRGDMIIGLQVLRKVEDKWRLFIAGQSDLKMKSVPSKLIKVIFPKTQEKWHKKLMEVIQHKREHERKSQPRSQKGSPRRGSSEKVSSPDRKNSELC